MNPIKFPKQDGISLIEVLVVIAIISVLTGFAVTRLGKSKNNLQRQNIARELKVSLERARFDSVKRRPQNDSDKSKVVIENATSFTAYLDLNQDGSISNSEKRQTTFDDSDGIKIVGENLAFPVTIGFDRRGQITADGTSSATNPSFTVCDKGCTLATATNSNSNKITISPTGTVTMSGGGSVEQAAGTPSISNVNPCDEVNNWATVANVSAPPQGCAASPTPVPSVSPSQSPILRICLTNETPSASNCICLLPLSVRSTGKCM